jgi:hypothetical protein
LAHEVGAGRAEIERLLETGHLQQVPASREHADRLLAQARRHLASAANTAEDDPEGAYALLYDAARKALWAILENQGLRPTSSGGHLAAHHAVRAQLDPPMGQQLRPYDRMRRHRRDAEYPPADSPALTGEDAEDDIPRAEGHRRHRREGPRPDVPVLTACGNANGAYARPFKQPTRRQSGCASWSRVGSTPYACWIRRSSI